jgi:hypothetical protein
MSDLVTTRVFTDGEKGITAGKLNDIIAGSSIQTSFVSSKPVASSTVAGDKLLLLKGSGTYAQIDSSIFSSSLVPLLPAPEPKIWLVRLRSYNPIGNNNFEVDQRNAGTTISGIGNNVFCQDRWRILKSGTMSVNTGLSRVQNVVPGTSFNISGFQRQFGVATQQTTLGAGDYFAFGQLLEGCQYRELAGDVTSISLLVYSDVANLKFSMSFRSMDGTRSLVKLCSVPNAGTWTLIQLPNIPQPTGGDFSTNGYLLDIVLACGATLMAPASDTWQNGNFLGAPGMDNWCAKPANTFFTIAAVQHESGDQCSTLMDKPWTQNYDECLRYYQKTYDVGVLPGAVTTAGLRTFVAPVASATGASGPHSFYKPLAKIPTVTLYNHATGAAGSVRDGNGTDHASAAALTVGTTGMSGIGFATGVIAPMHVYTHYTADSGM